MGPWGRVTRSPLIILTSLILSTSDCIGLLSAAPHTSTAAPPPFYRLISPFPPSGRRAQRSAVAACVWSTAAHWCGGRSYLLLGAAVRSSALRDSCACSTWNVRDSCVSVASCTSHARGLPVFHGVACVPRGTCWLAACVPRRRQHASTRRQPSSASTQMSRLCARASSGYAPASRCAQVRAPSYARAGSRQATAIVSGADVQVVRKKGAVKGLSCTRVALRLRLTCRLHPGGPM